MAPGCYPALRGTRPRDTSGRVGTHGNSRAPRPVPDGNGDGSFGPVTTFSGDDVGIDPTSPVAADVNGDGALDVALLSQNSGEITLLLGDGAGGFLESQRFHAGPKPKLLLHQ